MSPFWLHPSVHTENALRAHIDRSIQACAAICDSLIFKLKKLNLYCMQRNVSFGVLQAEAESREAEQMRKKLAKNDSSSLSALILHNQQSREKQMDAFFSDLATRYGDQDKASRTTHKTPSVTKKSAKKTSKTTKRTVSKSQAKSKAKKWPFANPGEVSVLQTMD